MIHAFRQTFLIFVKHEQEFKTKYGDFQGEMFREMHDKQVTNICELEQKLQEIMTPQSRNARQRDLQYQCHKMDNLIIALYLLGLSRESISRARPPRGYSQQMMNEYCETVMWQFIARNIHPYRDLPQPEILQKAREQFVSCFENDVAEIQWFKNFFSSYEECREVFERVLASMIPELPFQDENDAPIAENVGDELGDAVALQNFGDVILEADPV
jgi:hypothetical protein